MSRQVASRSQRRLEKKQALVLVVMGLVIALISYGLGVVVGRSGGETIVHEDIAATERIAIQPTEPNPASGTLQPAEEAADPQLTFYDTLPEGNQPPMGSGINMPAQPTEPVAAPVDVRIDREPAAEVVASKPAPAVVKPKPPANCQRGTSAQSCTGKRGCQWQLYYSGRFRTKGRRCSEPEWPFV